MWLHRGTNGNGGGSLHTDQEAGERQFACLPLPWGLLSIPCSDPHLPGYWSLDTQTQKVFPSEMQTWVICVTKLFGFSCRLPALHDRSDLLVLSRSCWVSRPHCDGERQRLPSSGEVLCGQQDHIWVLLWIHAERIVQSNLLTQWKVERLHTDLQPWL